MENFMSHKFMRQKEGEIVKAGRLFFDAVFGESKDLEQRVGDELDRHAAARGEDVAIPTTGHSFVRCEGCAREQIVAPNVDVRSLEQSGWKFANGAWRCSFCVSK
jgi:hypothetical protein